MNISEIKINTSTFTMQARLWIFPEGTRSHSPDEMLPFKKGAFNLAVEAQVTNLLDHNDCTYTQDIHLSRLWLVDLLNFILIILSSHSIIIIYLNTPMDVLYVRFSFKRNQIFIKSIFCLKLYIMFILNIMPFFDV